MTATDYIAIYGAIVATLVLLWDGIKWFATGPKLRTSARCHVVFSDSRVTKTERTELVEIKYLVEYCHIEVVNVGDRSTTITSIEGTHKRKTDDLQMFCAGVRFLPFQGKQLPQVLGSGEMWSARFEMTDLYSLAERGKPIIRIHASHKNDPISVFPKLKPELCKLARVPD